MNHAPRDLHPSPAENPRLKRRAQIVSGEMSREDATAKTAAAPVAEVLALAQAIGRALAREDFARQQAAQTAAREQPECESKASSP